MQLQLRRRTIQRIQTFVWFAAVYGVIGFFWEYIEAGRVTLGGVGTGIPIGLVFALMEEVQIARFTRSMSFSAAVLAKSFVYLGVIAIPIMLTGFVFGFVAGLEPSDFIAWVTSFEFVVDLVLILLIHTVVIFGRNVSRLLGPGTLMRYIVGRYHRPRLENRVFMFLDLKSSTMLAEKLGAEQYFSFLNDVFRHISEPILDYAAEIYQYVGDEVILTWPINDGLRNANCVLVFVEILTEIHSRREHYLQTYGYVPEFKAGVHFGEVVTAEIGDIKKDIAYSGDVLNTAARIQSKCNELGQSLIASSELVSALELPEFIRPRELGFVELRGKAEATSLVGLLA
ncbi:MAG: adenylate/guanylate cyclase domain-containing protein [Rhodothermales bacterium]|nr:adenylate/guanylate cyclase domain-containing protein [Rhodothermales bacterium]